jgi:hemin uptake protein HemP
MHDRAVMPAGPGRGAGGRTSTPERGPARASSGALLGPRGELIIEHAGEEYRLRRTRNGKLILTK